MGFHRFLHELLKILKMALNVWSSKFSDNDKWSLTIIYTVPVIIIVIHKMNPVPQFSSYIV